jgi:hypothetical protein
MPSGLAPITTALGTANFSSERKEAKRKKSAGPANRNLQSATAIS